MKAIAIFLFTFLFIFIFLQCNSQLTSPHEYTRQLSITEKQIAVSSEVFGLNLFSMINSDDQNRNIFISPLSVSMALGMTLNGANRRNL